MIFGFRGCSAGRCLSNRHDLTCTDNTNPDLESLNDSWIKFNPPNRLRFRQQMLILAIDVTDAGNTLEQYIRQ